tara:strand:- start:474 stop:1523 length:1050 start_codon:yes stop_codon:yes gene_type:complete
MIKIIIIQLILFNLFYYIFKKLSFFNAFLDRDFTKLQGFHTQPTPRYGGILIFLCSMSAFLLSQIDLSVYSILILFLIANFCLGMIDDIKFIINPFYKFSLFFLINILLIIFFNLKIKEFDLFFLDYLNNYIFFSVLITFFCIFFVVNGSNLIDGFNGLLSIHALIILIKFSLIINSQNNSELLNINLIIIISLVCFLFYNIPNAKIFLGDCGSFFIGTCISVLTIIIYNQSNDISPFYFAIVIYYIFIEIFFSVFRKLFQKKNPFYPDRKHLHMLLYEFLKIKDLRFKNYNFTTSILINGFYLISVFPSFLFMHDSFLCKIYFFFLISIYAIFYFFLNHQLKLNEKKN